MEPYFLFVGMIMTSLTWPWHCRFVWILHLALKRLFLLGSSFLYRLLVRFLTTEYTMIPRKRYFFPFFIFFLKNHLYFFMGIGTYGEFMNRKNTCFNILGQRNQNLLGSMKHMWEWVVRCVSPPLMIYNWSSTVFFSVYLGQHSWICNYAYQNVFLL